LTENNTANNHRLLNMMKGLYKSMEREWDEYAHQYGMTNAHLHVLWILSLHDGLKLSDLSAKGVWNLSTTHDIVTRMASKGLIRREKDMEDGRVTRVYITKEGQMLRDRTQADFDSGFKFKLLQVIEEFDDTDKIKFEEMMKKITKQILDSEFVNYVESSTEKLSMAKDSAQ